MPTINTTTLQHNAGKIKRQLGQEPRKFPLRDANQRSSIASVEWGLGEFNMTVEPKVNVSNKQCESWSGPFGTRSHLVSQSDGRRDIEVKTERNCSSAKQETITTTVVQYSYHDNVEYISVSIECPSGFAMNSRDTNVGGANEFLKLLGRS